MGLKPDMSPRGNRRLTVTYSIDVTGKSGQVRLTFSLETVIGPEPAEYQEQLHALDFRELTVGQQGSGYGIEGPSETTEGRLRSAFGALAHANNWNVRQLY
jgi:hypothetical protein